MDKQEQLRTRVKKKKFLEALELSLGVVTQACRQVDISRMMYYKWLKKDPEFAEKVAQLEDVALDFAESNLFKQIKAGVPGSTIFYLKTKGKKRGYVEKSEVEIIEDNKFADMTDDEIEKKLKNLSVVKGGKTGTDNS